MLYGILLMLLCSLSYVYSVVLYGSQGSRSPLVNWYLYELNVPFTMGNRIDNPHPWGQIPCLKHDDTVIFESGAILMYLADKFNHKEMGTIYHHHYCHHYNHYYHYYYHY